MIPNYIIYMTIFVGLLYCLNMILSLITYLYEIRLNPDKYRKAKQVFFKEVFRIKNIVPIIILITVGWFVLREVYTKSPVEYYPIFNLTIFMILSTPIISYPLIILLIQKDLENKNKSEK